MKRIKNFTSSDNILYLIATPIGNLKEMTPRALDVISQADLIAAEDTRNSQQLLNNFNIKKQLFSLREHNEKIASQHIINEIKNGKKVVYMSDAGYPCISDPGNILVKECLLNDIKVSTIAGSSAFLNAICSSGFNSNHFLFYGFLSSKDSDAIKELTNLKSINHTLIFYEAPHRIERTLILLQKVFGNRQFVLARELTKLNEEFIFGNLNEIQSIDFSTIKGELVLLVEGHIETNNELDIDTLKHDIDFLLAKGLTNKDIVDILVNLKGMNKNDIYGYVNKK